MIDENEKTITVRVNKKSFNEDSFRVVTVDRKKGISQKIGELAGETNTETHSFIFQKDSGWTKEAAKEWVESKDYTVKNVSSYVLGCAIEYMKTNDLDLKDIAFFTEANTFEVKELTSENGADLFWIKGYLSTYDIDRGSDYVRQGGYEKTNSEHVKLGKFPMLRDHSPCTDDQMGAWVKFSIDAIGYYVEGYIVVDEKSRHIVNLIKAGALDTLSAGGIWVYDDPERKNDGEKTITTYPIKDMLIFEGSIVTIPMNPQARFTAKSFKLPDSVPSQSQDVGKNFTALMTKLAEDETINAIIKKHMKEEKS